MQLIGFRQFLIETALEVLGDNRPLGFVALVQEGEAERAGQVVENLAVLGPGNYGAWRHQGRDIATGKPPAGQLGHGHHGRDPLESRRCREGRYPSLDDGDLVFARQVIQGGDNIPAVDLRLVQHLGAVIEAVEVAQTHGIGGGEQAEAGVRMNHLVLVQQGELAVALQYALDYEHHIRTPGIEFVEDQCHGATQCPGKAVLELGGSDPFIVLDDADLDRAVDMAMRLRFSNAGQICVAAKRFILLPGIAEAFTARMVERVGQLQTGDPLDAATTLAPMARDDLRLQLQAQVQAAISDGAKVLVGGEPQHGDGWFYKPTVLDGIEPGNTAFDEELFGPVAAIVRARDEADAVRLANATRFGLGASVWTADIRKGEALARQIEAGACFANAPVVSDLRMPFGGTKASGLGRELASYGIREFCNIKSLWVAE